MADTLPNIEIPSGIWTDIYAAAGIQPGVQLILQNIGTCDIFLTSQVNQPTEEDAYQIVERSQWVINDAGDEGAWAFCGNTNGRINVKVA